MAEYARDIIEKGGYMSALFSFFSGKLFRDHLNFIDLITLSDLIDHFKSFYHFTEAGVISVEVRSVVS